MATTATQLAEAQAALHQLRLGAKIARVTYEGRTVEYSATNIDELQKYIRELEAAQDSTQKRRPFGVVW